MASMRTLFLLSVFLTLTLAENCKSGLDYCGYNLLGIGNYQPQIIDALQKASLDASNKGVSTNTLFHCDGGYNGDISVVKFCTNRCIDGGPGKSDVCNEASSVGAASSSTVSTSSRSQTSGTTFSTTTQSTTASSTAASSTDMSDNSLTSVQKESVRVGAIAGGVVGGVVGLALVGLGFFFIVRRSRKAQKSLNENTSEQKSTQQVLLKHFSGPQTIPQDGTVLEALGDVARPRYELFGAPANHTEPRYELS